MSGMEIHTKTQDYSIAKALSQVTFDLTSAPVKSAEESDSDAKSPVSSTSCSPDTDLRNCVTDGLTVFGSARNKPKRRSSCVQPPNTIMYTVKSSDSLASIAAFYDTTPSVLKKINRLAVDFLHPDQVLYIPLLTNGDMVASGSSCSDGEKTSPSSDVPPVLEKSYPGLAHRVESNSYTSSPDDEKTESHTTSQTQNHDRLSGVISMADRRLSSIEQCLPQMFIKVNSKYILPKDEGEVDGTLLVTPNAVMFDPYVSDPIVIENGVEEYGLVAKLDTLISLAIYTDSEAMHARTKNKDDLTIHKPQIYHKEDCELSVDKPEDLPADGSSSEELCADRLDGVEDIPLSCSCGASTDTILSQSINRSNSKLKDTQQSDPAYNQSDTGGVDWSDNQWNEHSSQEASRVTFDIDAEAKSSPISCRPMTVNSEMGVGEFSPDSQNIDFDLGDEKISQSLEHKMNAFPSRKLGHVRNNSTASSIYSVGMTSQTEVYVDYSCGIFAQNNPTSSETKSKHSNLASSQSQQVLQNPSITKLKAEDLPHQRSENVSNGQNGSKLTLRLEGAITKEDKPDLFQPITDLVTNPENSATPSNPFYLCLQVGRRIDDRTEQYPTEQYENRHKPEYWFTIPSNKADALYMFFIEWRPDLYGEEISDVDILNSRGFMAIDEDSNGPCEEITKLPCSPLMRQLSHAKVFKDWEIVSIDEIMRRKSLLDIEKYLPLPELQGDSLLLNEKHIKQLAVSLPARVEGHRWRLAYSNEEHGFSLHTMYRNMCEFDSATLIVVQDEHDNLFGAFSSSPIHQCEHFYGTGECFLYTFVDGYRHFKWTSRNMFCVRGGQQGITFGTGSATCGLWLDADLYHGRTQHCDTYDNDPLTGGEEDFIIRGVEVWSLNDEEYD